MKSRLMFFVVIFGLGAIAIGWIYESRLRPRVQQVELIVPDNIDYFLTNMSFSAFDANGRPDYEFVSRRLEHYPRDDTSRIENPSLQIFRDNERWQVDSETGEFLHRQNLLWLRNQVVMRKLGEQPISLYSEAMRFEPDRDLVASDTPVVMQSKSSRIEAEQAVFDLDGQVFRFTGARALYDDEQS